MCISRLTLALAGDIGLEGILTSVASRIFITLALALALVLDQLLQVLGIDRDMGGLAASCSTYSLTMLMLVVLGLMEVPAATGFSTLTRRETAGPAVEFSTVLSAGLLISGLGIL